MEPWFAELTRKQLQRGVHRSTADLEADIIAFIAAHNETPHGDETTVLMLKEKHRKATDASYIWAYRSGQGSQFAPQEAILSDELR